MHDEFYRSSSADRLSFFAMTGSARLFLPSGFRQREVQTLIATFLRVTILFCET